MPMHKEFIGPPEVVFMTVAFILRSHTQAAQAQFVLQVKNYKGLYGKATGLF